MKTEDRIAKYLITESLGIASISAMLDDVRINLDIAEEKKAKKIISDFGKVLSTEINDMRTILDGNEKKKYESGVVKIFDGKFLPFLKKLEKKPGDEGLQKKVEEVFRKLEKEMNKF